MIRAWFDGAVEPHNPSGHGGIGVVVRRDNEVIYTEASYMGRWGSLTNNCAEYAAVIAALRYLIREGISEAVVYGDSDMVIEQLSGRWRVKGGAYVPYFREALALKRQVQNVKFIWIPREQNADADELSKIAVLKRPRQVAFALDPAFSDLTIPVVRKKNKRNRRRERPVEAVADDEAWHVFKLRYGDL